MPLFSRPVVGIELKDHLAQFVEIKSTAGKKQLSAYNRVSLPKGLIVNGEIKDEVALIEALKPLFAKANPKIGRIKKAALVLPSRLSFVHLFTFPEDFSVREIQKSLPLQAETVIPFSIDDVYWDFSVTGSGVVGEQHVIFAAISKEQADRYANVIQSLGVTPFLFGIEMDALTSALDTHLESEKTKLIIDLNALTANFLLFKGKAVLHFFSSNEGMNALLSELVGNDDSVGANYFERWNSLLENKTNQKRMEAFLQKRFKQGKKIVEKELGEEAELASVVLTGEFSTLTGSMNLAKQFFNEMPVEAGDPKGDLKVEASRFAKREEDFLEGELYSVFFTHVIGMAQRALSYKDATSVNLLPSSLRQRFKNLKLSLILSGVLILMMFINAVFSAYTIILQQTQNFQRMALESQKVNVERVLFGTRYQQIQEALTVFNAEVNVLSSIDAALFSVPAVIDEVMTLIPEGITVTELSFQDASLILDLSGVAQNREVLLELQDRFESSSMIEEAHLPISNYDQKSNISFTVSIQLNFTQLPDYGTASPQ